MLYLSFVEGDYENSGFVTGGSGERAYFYYHNLEYLENELKANSFLKQMNCFIKSIKKLTELKRAIQF